MSSVVCTRVISDLGCLSFVQLLSSTERQQSSFLIDKIFTVQANFIEYLNKTQNAIRIIFVMQHFHE